MRGAVLWWARPAEVLFRQLASGPEGLSARDAETRLRVHGPNEVREQQPLSRVRVLLAQLASPLLLLLVFAAAASTVSGEWLDASIVVAIVVGSVGIGYAREYGARAAVA